MKSSNRLWSMLLRIKAIRPHLFSVRGMSIAFSHLAMIALSFVIAFWIRFDFSTAIFFSSPEYSPMLLGGLPIVITLKLLAFLFFGLQVSWWRYAGLQDLARIYLANFVASAMCAVALF